MNPLLSSFLNVSAKGIAGADAVTTQQSTSGSEFKSVLEQASVNKPGKLVADGNPAADSSAQAQTQAQTVSTTAAPIMSTELSTDVNADPVATLTTDLLPTPQSQQTLTLTPETDAQVLVATAQTGSETAASTTSSGLTTSQLPTEELQNLLANANSALANPAQANTSPGTNPALGMGQSALAFARPEAGKPESLAKGLGTKTQNSLQAQTLLTATGADAEPAALAEGKLAATSSGLLNSEALNSNSIKLNPGNFSKDVSAEVLQQAGVKNLATTALTETTTESEFAGLKAESKIAGGAVQIASVSELARRFNLNSTREGRTLNFEQLLQGSRESMQLSQFVNEKISVETSGLATHSQFTSTQFADAARASMQMPVNISFGRPEWAGQVAERAALMSLQKIQVAELQLDPPDLGSLHVKVTVNSDQQASVTFVSPHANVRDALDQSVVRLRELLEQQGLDLVDVNVADQQQHAEDQEELYDGSEEHGELADTSQTEEKPAATLELVSQYGVDFYA